MIAGRSIVCFAHDWNGDPTSKTHIMRILARQNRVLWINSIGMRRPRASGADLRRLGTKLRSSLDGCREVEPNLFVMNPLTVPLPGVAAADRLNTWLLQSGIRRTLRRIGGERPILWTFLPNVDRLVGRLDESLVIYHCVDDYARFDGVNHESLRRMERALLRKSDIVFTSSERLAWERRSLQSNTHFVRHGVDVEHFSRALDPRTEIPEDIRGIRGPVIGFFGLLAEWVDLDLIRLVARAHRDWSIVLIGKATVDLSPVRGEPNVHILGQRPYTDLPAYCKAFDAGIIPFRVNALTLRANPLKLREYLAAGLPVVATPLPEIARYEKLVDLAGGWSAFVSAIERALERRGAAEPQRCVEAMLEEGWDARVEELSAVIERAQLRGPSADAPLLAEARA